MSHSISRPKVRKEEGWEEYFIFKSDDKLYRCPEIVKAVDFNPLLFFLVANLLTGMVNMSVETINTDDIQAVIIIIAYQAVLAVIVKLLYKFNIKMKFW